jgi:hypothetical protein
MNVRDDKDLAQVAVLGVCVHDALNQPLRYGLSGRRDAAGIRSV